MALVVKNPPARAGDTRDSGPILGSGRSPGVGNGNPLLYSCLEKFHGQRSLMGYSLWGQKELDTTEHQHTHTHTIRVNCIVVVVQSLNHVQLFATPWTAACQASLSFTIFPSLLKLMSVESVRPSNHLVFCPPLLLPSVFPSIRRFSNESALHLRWPKYWSFSFSISPSNEYSELISFRMDWLDLVAVQGTLKSLFQHHSSKASTLWHSAFFMVQTLTSIHDHWKNHSFD